VDCTGGQERKHTMKINSVSVASVIYFIILLIVMMLAFQMQAKNSLKPDSPRKEDLIDDIFHIKTLLTPFQNKNVTLSYS
jgi:hypothetical protein